MLIIGETGGRSEYGNSVLSAQFFYKPKLVLKKNWEIKEAHKRQIYTQLI